jgi:hypothetical protein
VEDLRATDRLLAEGIATVDEKVDRLGETLRAEMAAGFADMGALLRAGYIDLDRRLQALE